MSPLRRSRHTPIEACIANEGVADKVSPISRDNGLPNRSVTVQISVIVPNKPLTENAL